MMPKHEGITIKLAGEEYVVPPLSLGQVKRLLPNIEKMQQGTDTLDKFSSVVAIAHAALNRNYPDLKYEDVEELIDMGNFKAVLDAVMGASGFQRGGAQAGSDQTGTKSTPI
jgi:hypothetical protein